ncbi:MAG: PQQ-binding-like beta-propeller repeat protein [Kofleriaceae bacterium]|nr:PQQ-binding-like beta-propeller repeat protein [Kofleriaceae bacterium]MCL4224314.1 PQQ-binding-like beta-propeller repeat protein [Myxococcales bacterium]
MTYRENAHLPPEVDRSILVTCISGCVYGLDRATGAFRWGVDLDSRGPVSIGFRHDVLVVSASVHELTRLDYATGAVIWKAPTTGAGRATIVVESDCIVCAKGRYVDCFELDGRRRWSQTVQGHGEGAIALAFPGNVVQADGTWEKPRRIEP